MSQWVNICSIDDILPATGVCAGEYSVVMVGTEDRHLLLTEQGADAGGRQDVVDAADIYPLAHAFSSTRVTGIR